jgi:hypothetical protein
VWPIKVLKIPTLAILVLPHILESVVLLEVSILANESAKITPVERDVIDLVMVLLTYDGL